MSPFLKDLFERVIVTFVEGFLGAASLSGLDILHTDWKAWIGVGAAAGVAAVVKGYIARTVGDKNTASLAPALVTLDSKQ